VSAALEVSRSGSGAHVWIFFAEAVPARDARRLGDYIGSTLLNQVFVFLIMWIQNILC
jgi:hypothetical protein